MFCSNKRRNSKRSERGNAVLEFALGWSILWLLFYGSYQFGYAFYVYNRLMTAVTNAAELGSKIGYDTASPSSYTTALQNMVLYADETVPNNPSPIVSGLAAANVNVNVALDANGIPRDVTITIVNYSINTFFTNISLNNKPRATTMYYGQVSCSTC